MPILGRMSVPSYYLSVYSSGYAGEGPVQEEQT